MRLDFTKRTKSYTYASSRHRKKQCTIISGVYAPAQQKDKDSFWNHLFQLNSVIDLPWCLIGAFNELANPTEKKGG